MSRVPIAAATLGVVGIAVLASWLVADTAPELVVAKAAEASSAAAATAPTTARARLAPKGNQVDAEQDHSRDLLLPDGTYMPALNDAIDAAPLHEYWGAREWSPIVGVECNDAGVEWYRHENGSYSTTEMVMRSDLGRMAAMTRVAHIGQAPAAVAPAAVAPAAVAPK